MSKYINPFNPFIWYGDIPDNDNVTSNDISTIIYQMHTKMTNYLEIIKESHYQSEERVNEVCEGLQYNADNIHKLIKWIDDHDKARLVIGVKKLLDVIDEIVTFYTFDCGFLNDDTDDLKHMKQALFMVQIRSDLVESVEALSLSFGQGASWMIGDEAIQSESQSECIEAHGDDDKPHHQTKVITGEYNINLMVIHRMYLALTGRLGEDGKERDVCIKDVILRNSVSEDSFTQKVLDCDFYDLYADDHLQNQKIFSFVISMIWTDKRIIKDEAIRKEYKDTWALLKAHNPDCSGRKDSDHLKTIYSNIVKRQ